jgi:aldehyde:ferredoxin oxidoreductase
MESIIYANFLCNLYGIDTISCGKVISFAMECYENGIITKEETDGVDLSWGNTSAVISLIHKIGRREGLGKVLSEGVRRAAQAIGRGAERYAMHVKGLEVSGQDSRAQQSVGLTHSIAARGADHLTALSSLEEIGFDEVIEERFGREKLKEIQNLLSTTHKALVVKDVEDLYAVTDSLIICKYGTMWPPIYYFDDFARVIPPLTGMEEYADVSEVRLTAQRIVSLRRAFNIREGLDRKDDTLPKRFLKEPMPHGPGKGYVCNLDVMLNEYYRLRDWDVETGLPKRSSLELMGLRDVADTLGKMERVVA